MHAVEPRPPDPRSREAVGNADNADAVERAHRLDAQVWALEPAAVARKIHGFLQVVALRDMLTAVMEWKAEADKPPSLGDGPGSGPAGKERLLARELRAAALDRTGVFLRAVAHEVSRDPACDQGTRTFAGRIAGGLDTRHINPVANYLNIEMLLPKELLLLYPLLP